VSSLCGVLTIDKPPGLTSMDVVAAVRCRAGNAKTGHAGTLDPLATGVLLVGIGNATKLLDRFMATDKRYHTTIDLSAFTTTDDRQGERTNIAVNQPPTAAQVRQAIGTFVGRIPQRPPAFSAMKVGGRRAYKLARKGQPVELPARPVTVDSIDLIGYQWPYAELEIHCRKGFYVRSLARDLGVALGTGGHCTAIRRTAVGPFTLATARKLDDLPSRLSLSDLIPIDDALGMLART
jgi:tRNA pseudouridine55 synthase